LITQQAALTRDFLWCCGFLIFSGSVFLVILGQTFREQLASLLLWIISVCFYRLGVLAERRGNVDDYDEDSWVD
jgi:hypothetical protein